MKDVASIAALIPAAGRSERMGLHKPLLPLGKTTILGEAIQGLREAEIDEVLVVLGPSPEAFLPVLDTHRVRHVVNPHPERGMLSSILTGIGNLPGTMEAFFLLPADIPLVGSATIRLLRKAYITSRRGVVYPVYGGRRGHPPLIPLRYFDEAMPPDTPGGLRTILKRYDREAVHVVVDDPAVRMDCDTPEDYRRLLEYYREKAGEAN